VTHLAHLTHPPASHPTPLVEDAEAHQPVVKKAKGKAKTAAQASTASIKAGRLMQTTLPLCVSEADVAAGALNIVPQVRAARM
jgi:hypothetical protein